MILSGEWFGALALNTIRHRMASRHAIETVSARWLSQHRSSKLWKKRGGTTVRSPQVPKARETNETRMAYR
jgi:hypothetical protein